MWRPSKDLQEPVTSLLSRLLSQDDGRGSYRFALERGREDRGLGLGRGCRKTQVGVFHTPLFCEVTMHPMSKD